MILSKIFKNLLILFGILLAALFVLLFVMYFFGVSVFGLVFASIETGSTSLEMSSAISNVEVNCGGMPVNVTIGDKNQIIVVSKMQGVVKQREKLDKTGMTSEIEIESVESGNKLVVNVFEPKKIIAFYGESSVTVMIKEEDFENFDFTFKTKNGQVKMPETTKIINSVNFNSTKNGKIYINSPVKNFSAETVGGRIEINGTVLENAFIATKKAVVSLNKAQNVEIRATNSYVNFNEVSSLIYAGYSKTAEGVFKEIDAKGGKITGTKAGGVTVKARNIDVKIEEVNGAFKLASEYSTSIKINLLTASSTVEISAKRGSAKFDAVSSNKFEFSSTKASLTANFSSQNSAATATIKTTTGAINVNGAVVKNSENNFYKGTIKITTERGKIALDKIACLTLAQTTKSGDISAKLYKDVATMTSLQTARGNINVSFEANTKCFVSAFGKKGRTIDLSSVKEFEELGRPTPIFNATLADTSKLITLIATDGKVSIKEFF